MYIALVRRVFTWVFYFRGNLKKSDYSDLSNGRITEFIFERTYYCRLCSNPKCQFSGLSPLAP